MDFRLGKFCIFINISGRTCSALLLLFSVGVEYFQPGFLFFIRAEHVLPLQRLKGNVIQTKKAACCQAAFCCYINLN